MRANLHKWILSVILMTSVTMGMTGQIDSTNTPSPRFFAVIVSDLETSIRWYSDVLDLHLRNRVNLDERGFRQANLRSETAHLELIQLRTAIQPDSLLAGRPGSRVAGLFKVGFDIANFDAWVGRCQGLGVEIGNIVQVPETGKRMVIIRDPDGNRIQMFER